MTTVDLPVLMRADVLDVTGVDPELLVDLIRSVNADHSGTAGVVWLLRRGQDMNAPGLTAGVRGEVGAVSWFGETRTELPVDGLNDDWVEYYIPSGHDNSMPPGSELPVRQVLAAIEEYARTGARPTSLRWRPES